MWPGGIRGRVDKIGNCITFTLGRKLATGMPIQRARQVQASSTLHAVVETSILVPLKKKQEKDRYSNPEVVESNVKRASHPQNSTE